MMFAVVPVKSLNQAKSRLSAALDQPARARLAEEMLAGILRAVTASGAVQAVAVVSPDRRALDLARAAGATALAQPGQGLNPALEQARNWAVAGGASSLLVLLGDLPLLRPGEVAALAEIAAAPRSTPLVVIAPDRHDRGTNALLLRPPSTLPFYFGQDSYPRHLAAAHALGAEVCVYRSPGTAFDLDTVDDLAAMTDFRFQISDFRS